MNTQLLIDAVVQQVTVLIAQLATSGGLRAPVAHIANQVRAAGARAGGPGREPQGQRGHVRNGLRAYQRKLRRLAEAETDPGCDSSTCFATELTKQGDWFFDDHAFALGVPVP